MKNNPKENSQNFQQIFNTAKEVTMTAGEKAVVWQNIKARIICEKAKEVTMTADEKTRIWQNISAKIKNDAEDSPFTSNVSKIEATLTYSSRITSALKRKSVYRLLIGTVMFGLVISTGALTAIADEAMPGDKLYPIKVGIIERVQMNLASSVEEKADLELKHAATRLLEAESLAISGRLDEKAKRSIEKNFGSHVTSILSYAGKMHSNQDSFGAAELSSKLESTLMAHKDIMKQIEMHDSAASIAGINQSIEKSIGYASEIRISAEAYSVSSTSDNAKMRMAAEKASSAIQGSIIAAENSLKKRASRDTGEAEKQIAEARDYSAEGLAKLVNGAYGDALVLFGKAQRTAAQVSLEAEIIDRMNSVERMSASRRGAAKINANSLRILPQLEPLASTTEQEEDEK